MLDAVNRLDTFQEEDIEIVRASEILDSVYLLAAEIAQAADSDELISRSQYERKLELEASLLEHDMRYTVSGKGFIPIALPSGNFCTVFAHTEDISGTFVGFELAEGDMFEYDDKMAVMHDVGGFDDEDDELGGSSATINIDPELEKTLEAISEPEDEVRLFARFLLHREEGHNVVSGSAVVAPVVEVHAIMDVLDMSVTHIDKDVPPLDEIDAETVEGYLKRASQEVRQLTRDTKFRRYDIGLQKKVLESVINGLNSVLRVDRFYTFLSPDYIYQPTVLDGEVHMRKIDTSAKGASFQVDVDRVDSLEMNLLATRKRPIRSDRSLIDPDASLCVVGRVDEHIQRYLGLQSDVVWLPVKPERRITKGVYDDGFQALFMEKGLDALI